MSKLLLMDTGWRSYPQADKKKAHEQAGAPQAQAEAYCPQALKKGKLYAGYHPKIQRRGRVNVDPAAVGASESRERLLKRFIWLGETHQG